MAHEHCVARGRLVPDATQYQDPSRNLPGQCEEQSLRPVLGLLPSHLPTLYCFGKDFSRGALSRGHAVTVGQTIF